MKKILFSLAILALLTACGQKNFTVKGTIPEGETFPENTLVFLMDGETALDSAAVVDGKFQLKAPANPEKMYRIVAKIADRSPRDFSWNFGVIPEKGVFPVTFASTAADCTIEGSPINNAYNEFNAKIREFSNEYREKIGALADDAEEEAENVYNQLMEKVKGVSLEAIEKNADNFVAKNALQNIIYDLPLDELKSIIGKCGKFIGEDATISRIVRCKEAEIETAEGKPFVDFEGKTPAGEPVKLSDIVGKGKWVLADFWASWCGPCMGEIPNIKKTHETLAGDKFTVLGVAVWDGDNTKSAERMAEKEMTWPQIFVGEDKGPTDSYGIVGIPTMILFAPDGTIYKRGEELRGGKMMETVRDIINQ